MHLLVFLLFMFLTFFACMVVSFQRNDPDERGTQLFVGVLTLWSLGELLMFFNR